MLLSKCKLTVLVLLVAGLLGAGLTAGFLASGAKATAAVGSAEAPQSDKEKLQGEWQQLSAEGKEGKFPDDFVKKVVMIVQDDTMTIKRTDGTGEYTLTFQLDESKNPKAIEEFLVKPEKKDKPYRGIYSLDGDTATFCFSDPGEARPTDFSAKPGTGWTLTVFKRKAKE